MLRSYPVRDGRKEVVTRFHIRLLVLVREQEGVFFTRYGGRRRYLLGGVIVLLKKISIKGQG